MADPCPKLQECLARVRANATERERINREYYNLDAGLTRDQIQAQRIRDTYSDMMEALTVMYIEAGPRAKQDYVRLMMANTIYFGRWLAAYNRLIRNDKLLLEQNRARYADNMGQQAVIEVDCYNACK